MSKGVWALALCGIALSSWVCSPVAGAATCPNEAFRSGLSAELPDCRAYELVTPADSNGRLIEALTSFGMPPATQRTPTELASPTRDSVTFSTFMSALSDPKGASGVTDTYEAVREVDGWDTQRLLTLPGSELRNFLGGGVSPDHLYGFTITNDGLSPLSINGRATAYLRNPDGTFELVGLGQSGSEPYVWPRFVSEAGKHIVFSTGHDLEQSYLCFINADCNVSRLEPLAPPSGTGAVYDREADGDTRVVSLLPGDEPLDEGEEAFWKGTSKDGTATAFEVKGNLYIRLDNQETKQVTSGNPIFAGVSDHGGHVFYVVPAEAGEAGVIHRYDTAAGIDEVIPGDEGLIVNVSGDGSHVYFISKAQLDGAEGTKGQPNLYVWSGGTPDFVATVLPSDLVQTSDAGNNLPALGNWTGWVTNRPKDNGEEGPGPESSRTTPDGRVLVFESKAKLTPYGNGGHTEIYRYDDGDGSLVCVSCNPEALAPSGDAQLQNLILLPRSIVVHNLTDDGSHVFFETDDALVAADTDNVNDLYEWMASDGLPHLISTGLSTDFGHPVGYDGAPAPNVLFSVTPNGHDVLFLSLEPLVAGAPEGGGGALYDARVNGGFPAPLLPHVCLEEGCKPPAGILSPTSSGSASETAKSSGNVRAKKHRRHCRKAKRKKHSRCTKHRTSRRLSFRAAKASVAMSEGREAGKKAVETSPEPARSSLPIQGHGIAPASYSSSTLAVNPFDGYGIEKVTADLLPATAGGHPDFITNIALNHSFTGSGELDEETARTEEVTVSVSPGLLANINAVPRCSTGDFVAVNCSSDSQIGITNILTTFISGKFAEPIYNLEPPQPNSEIARFGFIAVRFPVFIDIKVRTASDYGATATISGPSGLVSLVTAKTTLWGNPANDAHDKERLTPVEADDCQVVCEGGSRPSTIAPEERKAFMTNPSACQSGQVGFAAKSYQLPGQVFTASAPLPDIADCTGLPFAPSFTAEPTSHAAGAPTGMHTTLVLPQQQGEEERSTATMQEARVTFPAGMQIAAGTANWIGTCSDDQVGYHQEVDVACPDNSKLGTATISSPALPEPIQGAIYQRTPTPGHQFGLWLTADALGLHIKLPGELEAAKDTGRLTAVFRDLPQVPVGQIDLDVWGGPRAPLQNPDHCGTYTTDYTFAPHSNDPAVSGRDQMTIDQGCDQGFSPILHAGVTNPVAGAFSPLVVDLRREDGEQALRGFELHMPDGELAKIKGVPLCSDVDTVAGTCPTGSRIGSLEATTGPGPDPLQVPQPGKPEPQIYLAGPYQSAPFSIVSEVPAQAGPFDLGVLAVRSALQVDPETGRATVKADPLPQFFEGVGITYRQLHAVIDRPGFSLNPTDCREAQVTSDVASTTGTVAHPAARFQIDGCKALKFKPKLSLKLRGGTERAAYPALTAVLKARRGDANIASTSVALPHSEFLAQEHIGTICTRKQFVADKCPRKSVYGKAKAWTPLLDKPLVGSVYLRSSDHPLPDMVVKLEGQLEIYLVGRIDSVNGGIRTTFETVPDAPVSKFVLKMRGGNKGLLTNSTDICHGAHRATVAMRAQNGRALNLRPRLQSSGCGQNGKGENKR